MISDAYRAGRNIAQVNSCKIIMETEGQKVRTTSKYVKLKFTQRQFEAFKSACEIFSVVSEHEEFYKIVKDALEVHNMQNAKIKSQMVTPIISAPLKEMIKSTKKDEEASTKMTHFNKPITATRACRAIYDKLHPVVQASYKKMEEGTTSITEIRTMVSKYVAENNLKTEKGIVVDDFLKSIAPATFRENEEFLYLDEDVMTIPKSDRSILYKVAEEISKSS